MSNTIKLGDAKTKFMLGTSKVKAIYLGDAKVWNGKQLFIQFAESGTYDLSDYGYEIGDTIDVFLVGGSGGTGGSFTVETDTQTIYASGGDGGSGKTLTQKSITLSSLSITVTVGEKGANGTSYFDSAGSSTGTATTGSSGGTSSIVVNSTTYQAYGGSGGSPASAASGGDGGNGGSGGGAGAYSRIAGETLTGSAASGTNGIDGADGNDSYVSIGDCGADGGTGQGTTTRLFGEITQTTYDNFNLDGIVMVRGYDT